VACAALPAAACSSQVSVTGTSHATPEPVTARPSPTATPTPVATSSSAALPSAADGTDLAACRDGSCEVTIEGAASIPLSPRFGVTAMRATVSAGVVNLDLRFPTNGSASVDCTGDPRCSTTIEGDTHETTGSAIGHRGARIVAGHISVLIIAANGGGMVLRIAPAS
jgi:hypothetical protein